MGDMDTKEEVVAVYDAYGCGWYPVSVSSLAGWPTAMLGAGIV